MQMQTPWPPAPNANTGAPPEASTCGADGAASSESNSPGACGAARAELLRRGRRLEWFTLGWNVLEGAVAVGAGILAGSVALVGFGADSFIESLSGAALLWRLRAARDTAQHEERALRLVGAAFLLLAAYVGWDAATSLLAREAPQVSPLGIGITLLSIAVMPILSRAKKKLAAALDSRALQADARQTDICVYLSFITLAGLALNALFGWWWADGVAALCLVPIIAKEGWDGLRGQGCGCH
jgi:divalent metal cation (Fe/Co/Zn/Cd) transporter